MLPKVDKEPPPTNLFCDGKERAKASHEYCTQQRWASHNIWHRLSKNHGFHRHLQQIGLFFLVQKPFSQSERTQECIPQAT